MDSEINRNHIIGPAGIRLSDRVQLASKNKNRELVRPFGDALRSQNHLQSSCSMSFVAINHKLSAQFRLSFKISGIYDFGRESITCPPWVHRANWLLIRCKFASKNKNRELVRPFGDVLRSQDHLQSSCSMSFVARNHKLSA